MYDVKNKELDKYLNENEKMIIKLNTIKLCYKLKNIIKSNKGEEYFIKNIDLVINNQLSDQDLLISILKLIKNEKFINNRDVFPEIHNELSDYINLLTESRSVNNAYYEEIKREFNENKKQFSYLPTYKLYNIIKKLDQSAEEKKVKQRILIHQIKVTPCAESSYQKQLRKI